MRMSDVTNVKDGLKTLQIGTNKDEINIILLGETGVGKSTFINAIANYLNYANFENVQKEKVFVLVPFVYTIDLEDGKSQKIGVGLRENGENSNIEDFATQDIRTYVFPIEKGQIKVRITDTPGLNGTKKDNIIFENILNYINNLDKLHAICFLFTPSKSNNIDYFEKCLNSFFPQLTSSVSKNVIFIFTNSSDSNYDARDLCFSLKKIVENNGMQIPLDKNIFYLENESLQYLLAVKNGVNNMRLKESTAQQSWMKSTIECRRFINYIIGGSENKRLKPYHVADFPSTCRMKWMITKLIEPLVDVELLISYNIDILQNHQNNLNMNEIKINERKGNLLYIPHITLETIRLNHPLTVCVACAKVVKVGDLKDWHYQQVCHKFCYLTGIREDLIDDTQLKHCVAMDKTKTCVKCFCDYSTHRHIYYMTKTKLDRIDWSVTENIDTTEKGTGLMERLINDIKDKENDLKKEQTTIVTSCAMLMHFLQRNTLSSFRDPCEAYIEFLISREKSLEESLWNKKTLHHLEMILNEYRKTKLLGQTNDELLSKKILNTIQSLYKLTLTGKKIKELYDCQKNAWQKEHQSTVYVIKDATETAKIQEMKNKAKKSEEGRNRNNDNLKNARNQIYFSKSATEQNLNKNYKQFSRKDRNSQLRYDNRERNRDQPSTSNVNVNIKSFSRNTDNKSKSTDCQNDIQSASGRHDYPPGPRIHPLGQQNHPGLQNYSCSSHNYLPSPQEHHPGSHNYPTRPPNYPPGPPNCSLGPPNYPLSSDNYPTGPPSYPSGPPSYPPGQPSYPPGPPSYPPGPPSYPSDSFNNPGLQSNRHGHYKQRSASRENKWRSNSREQRGRRYNKQFNPKNHTMKTLNKTESSDSSSESSSIDTSEPSD